MKQLSNTDVKQILKDSRISSRLAGQLKYDLNNVDNWEEMAFLALFSKSQTEGVLIAGDQPAVIEFEFAKKVSTKAGKLTPITCDFCRTWQGGGGAARITFKRRSDGNMIRFLCCGDLECTQNAMGLTAKSVVSKAQLPEQITVMERVARLKSNADKIVADLTK